MKQTEKTTPPGYLKPAEIARDLNIHPTTIAKWCNPGARLEDGRVIKLKHLKLPRCLRIKREDLDAFLTEIGG